MSAFCEAVGTLFSTNAHAIMNQVATLPGELTGGDQVMSRQDKERLWNCRAAIVWMEKRLEAGD
ncbi:hypothetical protein HCH_03208 [Hahella chejuensis KCTC 2396]|uniref:Uncharacterized protein n=1 Tax=Hahella chejuensis (strain KCTC 2396) TaxID=349521 RepID=Q2SHA5_HAHCH|nr:hypothetical protein HCH_03208 [Hahella chejuensis KCTC 2396]